MELRSQFNLKQPVWHITCNRVEQYDLCPSCTGGQIVMADGRTMNCPRCETRGTIATSHIARWRVGRQMTVGQIRIVVGGEREEDKEEYMTFETGVGSGSVYYGKDLFPTHEAAQEEADRRNREPGETWSCIVCNPQFVPVKYSASHEWRWCYVHRRSTDQVATAMANKLLADRLAMNLAKKREEEEDAA